jgi:hypothetical protein
VRDVIEQVMKVQGKWMEHFDAKFDWWWKIDDARWMLEDGRWKNFVKLCDWLCVTLCYIINHIRDVFNSRSN